MNPSGAPLAASVPWLLGVALCFAAASLTPPKRRALVALAALTFATLAARALLLPFHFFHQNGHGPEQVARAVALVAEGYGPGAHELFHGAITLRPQNPEAAVGAVQSLLGALVPAAAWSIARAVGARGTLPWALALAVALDPLLARLSRSESYLGAGSALVFVAMALGAHAGVALRRRRVAFLCAAVASGAVVAQAARLHPWLWAATATVPVGLLLARGAWRRRVTAALALALVIAALTLVTSGRAMWIASHSDLSARFSQTLLWALPARLQWTFVLAGPALVAMVIVARNRRGAALASLAAGVSLALFAAADLPSATSLRPWIHGAYARLYLPAWVALVAYGLRDLGATQRRRYGVAVLGGALVLGPAVARWPVERTLPTDAREQSLARAWRARLPPGEAMIWLAEADAAVLKLPIYPGDDPRAPRLFPANPARLNEDHQGDRRPDLYYRSSLCATEAGAPACARFEATHRLRPLATWELPALPSYFVEYTTPTVQVGLYRVER